MLLSIFLGLVINEACDVSPWLGRHIVRLAAVWRYGDTERGKVRAEEWAAYISTRPGKLLKLCASWLREEPLPQFVECAPYRAAPLVSTV